jgi:signal transduction histidine kinase
VQSSTHRSNQPTGRGQVTRPSPVLRLTLSYVAILLVLSVTFSAVLYQFSDAQLQDSLRNQYNQLQPSPLSLDTDRGGPASQFDPEQIQAELGPARRGLIIDLVYFNVFVLIAGTGLSYWLAKRTIRPIQQALEAQTRFTADASHELRTPLSVMQTGIETLRRNPATTKQEALKLLDSNLEEVSKLRSLAEGLLQLARSNGKPLAMQPVAVGDIAGDAIDRVSGAAKSKRITVLNDVAEANVLGDQGSLIELIVILLDNAIKYSEPDSLVTLASRKAGRLVELAVSDKGRGIAPQDIGHIFERFYRADKSRSNIDVEGHGLGLSIAKQIADAHKSEIKVVSTPGKGTTFIVSLQLAQHSG